jgi:hypothetical protein
MNPIHLSTFQVLAYLNELNPHFDNYIKFYVRYIATECSLEACVAIS